MSDAFETNASTRARWAVSVCTVVALLAAGAAAARTWTDGANDGLWSSAANWPDNTFPGEGDTVVFSGTPRTVTLTANTPALAGMTFFGSGTGRPVVALYLAGHRRNSDRLE